MSIVFPEFEALQPKLKKFGLYDSEFEIDKNSISFQNLKLRRLSPNTVELTSNGRSIFTGFTDEIASPLLRFFLIICFQNKFNRAYDAIPSSAEFVRKMGGEINPITRFLLKPVRSQRQFKFILEELELFIHKEFQKQVSLKDRFSLNFNSKNRTYLDGSIYHPFAPFRCHISKEGKVFDLFVTEERAREKFTILQTTKKPIAYLFLLTYELDFFGISDS